MTCKDCIHDRVCVAVKAIGEEQRYAEHCKSFKNKADYAEVKHGKWFTLDDCANEGVYCSVCHKKVYKKCYANQKLKSNYCPNCGAKMDVTYTNAGGK